MSDEKKVDLLDFIIIFVKWKKFFLFLCLPVLFITYFSIYFLVDEQFESSALIIPSDDGLSSGLSGLLGGLGGDLPFNLGGMSSNPELDMYNTIIYSRTNIEKVIEKFDLYNIYKIDQTKKGFREDAIKAVSQSIQAKETETMAYQIVVTANTPKLATDIANFIVDELNEKLIELRTQKSKNNREFLAERVTDIKTQLSASEDSLMKFQEKSGILDPQEQFKGIVSAYTSLETQLITKQVQSKVVEKLRGTDSPEYNAIDIEVSEFENRLSKMRESGEAGGIMPSLNKLPQKGISYFRLLRNVEINSKILEFILPLYEQAKLEEKKDIPTLQIIDYAVPPTKKSFPPRAILTLLVTFIVFLFAFLLILLKENRKLQDSEKMKLIKSNFFRWKSTI
jgi:uncharacterized protein involved in exopolysaccharide biosynthesis